MVSDPIDRRIALIHATALAIRPVADAMAALDRGDGEHHDALIAAAIDSWSDARKCDALMLAQFSMARARDAVQARTSLPVLVSTDSAVVAMLRAMGYAGNSSSQSAR